MRETEHTHTVLGRLVRSVSYRAVGGSVSPFLSGLVAGTASPDALNLTSHSPASGSNVLEEREEGRRVDQSAPWLSTGAKADRANQSPPTSFRASYATILLRSTPAAMSWWISGGRGSGRARQGFSEERVGP